MRRFRIAAHRRLAARSVAPLAMVIALGTSFPGHAKAEDYLPGEVQVKLRAGAAIEAINTRYGTTTLDSLPPLYLLDLPDGIGEGQAIEILLGDPDVVEAEYSWENQTPEGVRQMMVAAVGGTITDYIDQRVTERIRLGDIHGHSLGDGIKVAVLDTGIRADHPALEGAIDPGGWDFVDNDADPAETANGIDEDQDGLTDEGAGHGTMVAGIVHLVAPHAQILPIRVLDDEGIGRSFEVAKGIAYAIDHGAQVVNLSLGLTHGTFVIQTQLLRADSLGIHLVAAAGNNDVESPETYPASDRRVLSVAALDSIDAKAVFSSYNREVAISAPGVGILAPYYDGEYAIGAGTSFAAPFIAGQLALVRAMMPSLSKEEVSAVAAAGVVDIYQIPENLPYLEKLGTGRFDGLATWLAAQAVSDAPELVPSESALTIWPNPARGGELVFVRLPAGRRASDVEVLDVMGRRVGIIQAESVDGLVAKWRGIDGSGARLPGGVYFVRLTIHGRTAGGRIVLAGE